MYLFFLIFFIFISFSLIFLILLQPGKGLNNTPNLNAKNSIKLFNSFGTNSFITNIIGIFSFLFLIISIILCNINSNKISTDFFLENKTKDTIIKKSLLNKEILNSDIPH